MPAETEEKVDLSELEVSASSSILEGERLRTQETVEFTAKTPVVAHIENARDLGASFEVKPPEIISKEEYWQIYDALRHTEYHAHNKAAAEAKKANSSEMVGSLVEQTKVLTALRGVDAALGDEQRSVIQSSPDRALRDFRILARTREQVDLMDRDGGMASMFDQVVKYTSVLEQSLNGKVPPELIDKVIVGIHGNVVVEMSNLRIPAIEGTDHTGLDRNFNRNQAAWDFMKAVDANFDQLHSEAHFLGKFWEAAGTMLQQTEHRAVEAGSEAYRTNLTESFGTAKVLRGERDSGFEAACQENPDFNLVRLPKKRGFKLSDGDELKTVKGADLKTADVSAVGMNRLREQAISSLLQRQLDQQAVLELKDAPRERRNLLADLHKAEFARSRPLIDGFVIMGESFNEQFPPQNESDTRVTNTEALELAGMVVNMRVLKKFDANIDLRFGIPMFDIPLSETEGQPSPESAFGRAMVNLERTSRLYTEPHPGRYTQEEKNACSIAFVTAAEAYRNLKAEKKQLVKEF